MRKNKQKKLVSRNNPIPAIKPLSSVSKPTGSKKAKLARQNAIDDTAWSRALTDILHNNRAKILQSVNDLTGGRFKDELQEVFVVGEDGIKRDLRVFDYEWMSNHLKVGVDSGPNLIDKMVQDGTVLFGADIVPVEGSFGYAINPWQALLGLTPHSDEGAEERFFKLKAELNIPPNVVEFETIKDGANIYVSPGLQMQQTGRLLHRKKVKDNKPE